MKKTTPRFLTSCLLFISLITMNSCIVMVHQLATAEDRARKGKTDKKDERNFSERLFTAEELGLLKSTTTLFLLRKQDLNKKEEFEKAISSVWNYTNIKVINYDELESYKDGNYSLFILEGYNTSVQNYRNNVPTLSYDISHLFLTLKYSYLEKNKKGKEEEKSINYCRIELFTDYGSMFTMTNNDSEEVIDLVYNSGVLKNWSPGMLKLYLKEVQTDLEQSKRSFLFESVKNEAKIQKLKNDTLFVPSYVLTKFNKFNGRENKSHESSELFKGYPYPYQIIDPDELSRKVVDEEIEYVFDYVKSSTDNFIRVFSLSGGMIYQSYKAVSYNLKSKNINKIIK